MRHFLYFIFLIAVSSCKKDSLFWTPGPALDFIVEGGVCTLDSIQYIKLSKPIFFFEEETPDLDSAIVQVSNGSQVFDFEPTADKGVYRGIIHASADGPKVYHLSIRSNGKSYEATDTLHKFSGRGAAIIDKFVVKGDEVEIGYSKHNFGKGGGALFLLERAPFRWNPLPEEKGYNYSYSYPFGTPNALGKILSPSITHVFNINDRLDMHFFSISPAYSKFLYGIFRETDWKGPLSSVSGNVKGNISGNAGGFFYVMDGVKKNTSILEHL